MGQDLGDSVGVVDAGDETQLTATALAGADVGFEDTAEEACVGEAVGARGLLVIDERSLRLGTIAGKGWWWLREQRGELLTEAVVPREDAVVRVKCQRGGGMIAKR